MHDSLAHCLARSRPNPDLFSLTMTLGFLSRHIIWLLTAPIIHRVQYLWMCDVHIGTVSDQLLDSKFVAHRCHNQQRRHFKLKASFCQRLLSGAEYSIQFNSIQNSLFSTQHIVHAQMFSCMQRVEKGAISAYVGSFPILII